MVSKKFSSAISVLLLVRCEGDRRETAVNNEYCLISLQQEGSSIRDSSCGVKAEELMEMSGDSMEDVVDHRCNDEVSPVIAIAV